MKSQYKNLTTNQIVKKWLLKARYDLDTASAMLSAGRYFYVMFCCQQAIEKCFKAMYSQKHNELPPRIHTLSTLAEHCRVQLDEQQDTLARLLTKFYIDSRYPEFLTRKLARITKSKAQKTLESTQEFYRWLLTFLK